MRCSRQQPHGAHLRADEPFDVTAIMRLPYDTPNVRDAFVTTGTHKRATPKIRTIV
jgi:hypothetical protein